CRGRPRLCRHSVRAADRPPQAENCPGDPSRKTSEGPLCHPMGQAAPDAHLREKLLRGARRVHAECVADYATVNRSQTKAVTSSSRKIGRTNLSAPHLCRARNLVERFFNKIKQCRRVATRYDKLAANYL